MADKFNKSAETEQNDSFNADSRSDGSNKKQYDIEQGRKDALKDIDDFIGDPGKINAGTKNMKKAGRGRYTDDNDDVNFAKHKQKRTKGKQVSKRGSSDLENNILAFAFGKAIHDTRVERKQRRTKQHLQNCIDKASETMSAESGKQVKSVAYYAAQLDYKRLKKSMQKQHRKEERHNKLKSLSGLLGHSIPSYISNKNMREITNNKGSIGAIDGRSESVVSGDINNTMGKNSVNNNVNVNSNSNVDLDTDFESPLL